MNASGAQEHGGTAGDAPAHRYTAALAGRIEPAWQERWEREGVHRAANPGEPGFDAGRPKFYCLDMFPYPSGAGLHVGHPEGYTATDIVSRYKRMRGYNVLHPMGWDAFGLPAEQYAIQTGIHPAQTTRRAIDEFRRQLKRFGFSYDWTREFGTIDEGYYRWTQWIFLQIYHAWYDAEAGRARPIGELLAGLERGEMGVGVDGELVRGIGEGAGTLGPLDGQRVGVRLWHQLTQEERRAFVDGQRLAYVGEQVVNWCPKLGTVLANEEVIDGRSERGGHPVYRRPLRQWLFRITAYAERLLRGLEGLDWPASTRTMQAEWIGRSEGAEIEFELAGDAGRAAALRVFTTRPDTIFGATFMVVAPEHPLVEGVLSGSVPTAGADLHAVRAYVEGARRRADVDRQGAGEKTGVFLGVEAVNPATGARIPVWTADYVLMGYGTGAIMGVPGQDERDWAFAERHGLRIVRTVRPPAGFEEGGGKAYTGEGPAINSGFLDGLGIAEAKRRIIAWLEEKGAGRARVTYKLRDWLFSRQRYWGEPIPIVYDAAGRHHPVMESALPVRLPELADYHPEESDDPRPLLAKVGEWVKTTAGAAGVDPREVEPGATVWRETNTMPGWAGSCWYYLRFCDARNAERFVSKEAEAYWMRGGVDLYVGGAEHAVLHLLYARFWHQVLYDLGHVTSPEPFRRLFHQGLITSYAFQRADGTLVPADQAEESGGGGEERWVERGTGAPLTRTVAKMSKSLKNVVNPDEVIAEYGADTFRLYEMYMGPLEASKPWNPRDIVGCFRFLQRAWRLMVDEQTGAARSHAGGADHPAHGRLERALHRLIAKAGEDIERLAFNTAIAAMIEFVNAATAAGVALRADQVDRFTRVLSPFAPHLADEVRQRHGLAVPTAVQAWPGHDPAMLRDAEVELPVQVQGKVRGRVTVPADASPAEVERVVLGSAWLQEHLGGRAVARVIVVPGKMVNVVPGA